MFNVISKALICLTTYLLSTSLAPDGRQFRGMAGVSAQYLLGVGRFSTDIYMVCWF